MAHSTTTSFTQNNSKLPFNWRTVGFLLFLFGIPAIPAVFIVALVIAGALAPSLITPYINAQYYDVPIVILMHGISGVVFFLTVPFQFSQRLRESNAAFHKKNGYIAYVSACVMAASGVWMHHVFSPTELGARYFSLVFVAIAICASYSLAVFYAIQRDIKKHTRWVYYAVAASLAIITPLFLEIIAVILLGQIEHLYNVAIQVMHGYGRLIAFFINIAIAQLLLRKQKSA